MKSQVELDRHLDDMESRCNIGKETHSKRITSAPHTSVMYLDMVKETNSFAHFDTLKM